MLDVPLPATAGGSFQAKKRIGSYPRVRVEGGGRGVVSRAGAVLLVETVRKSGLDAAISAALEPWRKARTVHDPGKTLLDVALAVALGGDCLADAALLRAEPAVFGPVASDHGLPPDRQAGVGRTAGRTSVAPSWPACFTCDGARILSGNAKVPSELGR
ncbi:hypothetical protein TPA0910_80200 [Streptomyces hygroscopicus subsp. sporocinereus]|uniref:Transposase DDE domain-containing protein n=1 Tax=Streptomyces hygroscopicus TaxID=1912 RepID=A0ABQ3UD96_STRHY|nr:hypothetical protein TPA0910_80200 [Streptomyces hygroscopicus]